MGSNSSHVQNEDCTHSFNILTSPDEGREWSYVAIDNRKNETDAPLVRDIGSFSSSDLNSAFPPEPTRFGQDDAGIEIKDCTISCNKVDTEPRPYMGSHGQTDGILIPARSPTRQSNAIQHVCKTQSPLEASIRSIYVGENGTAHRWVRGSVITYTIDHDSFPNPGDDEYATKSFEAAVDAWNRGGLGVSFQRVPDNKPAVFQFKYSKDDGGDQGWLALAFFPYEVLQGQQPQLCVFPSAFKPKYYNWMVNVLCHELGHVLGLRHQFAQTNQYELIFSSVQVGEDDSSSVMNRSTNLSLLCIQQSDLDGVREFYAFDSKNYNGFKIKEVVPRKFSPSHHFTSRSSSAWSLVSIGT